MASTIPLFPNYMQLRARGRVSARIWARLRYAAIAIALIYVGLLLFAPEAGLVLLWQLTVPALPLVFLLAPGLWRNLCPLAAANQTPRRLGLSRALTPPAWFKEYGFVIGVVAFFALASSRKWLFNESGLASGALLLGALVLATLGGYLFKGKSGWCSSICPLYPVQRLYNQTAFVTVANAHCDPCVGCTTNCYDFNPGVAYLADLYADDRHYVSYRTFFAAAMPGFAVAYFTVPAPTSPLEIAGMYGQFVLFVLVSVGSFHLLNSFLKVSLNKITALYAAAAFNLFYVFGLPGWLDAVAKLAGQTAPVWLAWVGSGSILAVTIAWVWRTYRKEPIFVGQLVQGEETRIASGAAQALKRVSSQARPEITFAPSNFRVVAEAGRTLLEIAEANDQPIEAGCRMGVCGADPVRIVSGMENLAPVGSDERSTLERLGLGETCRMACMCRIQGPVTVALDARSAPMPPATLPMAKEFDQSIARVVIVGNGIAGVTAADYVRRNHPECEIHLIGRERHHLYNRMAITRLIYGRSAMSGLYLQPDSWYDERKITCWLNTHAASIDREQRQVRLATNDVIGYDRLILANGSASFVPPIPGYGMPGSYVLREAEEAMGIRAFVQANRCRRAVVAGGGLLGLEAAYALHKLGLDVRVLERSEWLLRRQLDQRGAHLLEQYLKAMGMTIVTRAETEALEGDGRVEQVTLRDGRMLPCELFLVAAGITPNVELATSAGLAVKRGVVVDEGMHTSDPAIFAAGDVCEYGGQVPGLWPVAVEQARVAAINAAGGRANYEQVVPVTALKVVGVDVLSIGRFQAHGEDEREIVLDDLDGHRYRKLVHTQGKLIGAILIGYPQDGPVVTAAVKAGLDVSADLEALQLGRWEVLAQASTAV
jgi:NADPH-dependent 2,4-dienoyl-CoA reductase/sulfur reductase-like enzyme/ferredoxin